MYQTIYAFIDTNEKSKVGYILDLSLNSGAHRVLLSNNVPWIGLHLFHTQANPFVFFVQIENHCFNHVALGYDL